MEEAKKPIDLTSQMGQVQARRPRSFSSAKSKFPELEKKLDYVFENVTELKDSAKQDARILLDNFLQGQNINLRFSFGPAGKAHNAIIRGLMTIYANSQDLNLQLRAKEEVRNSLNPLLNPQLAIKIIETYNNSKFNKFPVTKIDADVNYALEKGFELNFNMLWDLWIKKNVGPENTYIAGNFVGLVYQALTGVNGTRNATWFAKYYNDYKTNPEKFKQGKAVDPTKVKLDKSNHTISDIIQYIYSVGNPKGFNAKRADAFSKANNDILDFLQKNVKNPLAAKIFQYVVMNKLDSEEIMDMDKDFDTSAKVSGTFNDLAKKNLAAVKAIDNIYKNYKLDLPSFSMWKSSDFNKGPSDRGELEKSKLDAEVGRDDKGNLAKIKYDKFGDKNFIPLQELRLIIRRIMIEQIKNKINII